FSLEPRVAHTFLLDQESMQTEGRMPSSWIRKSKHFIHNNQDCILLCYSFSQILNKIKLATLKQNCVLNGFDSKESRSQNARSFFVMYNKHWNYRTILPKPKLSFKWQEL